MKRHNDERWDWHVMSKVGFVGEGRDVPENLAELVECSRVRCFGGGSEHSASVCMDCPRFVGVKPAARGRGVEIRCWWPVTAVKNVEPEARCDSCGSVYQVAPHPTMSCVDICAECLELSRTPIDHDEIGAGD